MLCGLYRITYLLQRTQAGNFVEPGENNGTCADRERLLKNHGDAICVREGHKAKHPVVGTKLLVARFEALHLGRKVPVGRHDTLRQTGRAGRVAQELRVVDLFSRERLRTARHEIELRYALVPARLGLVLWQTEQDDVRVGDGLVDHGSGLVQVLQQPRLGEDYCRARVVDLVGQLFGRERIVGGRDGHASRHASPSGLDPLERVETPDTGRVAALDAKLAETSDHAQAVVLDVGAAECTTRHAVDVRRERWVKLGPLGVVKVPSTAFWERRFGVVGDVGHGAYG